MRNAEVEGKGFLARVACGAVIVQPRRVGVVVRVLACASLVAVGVGVASGRAAALAAPNLMLAKIPAPVRPIGTWSLRVSVSGDLPPDTEVELSVSRDRLKDRGAFISSINDFPAPGPNKTKVTTALAKDVARDGADLSFDVTVTDEPASHDLTLKEPGVYPVLVRLHHGSFDRDAELHTYLVRLPGTNVDRMRVAFVLPIGTRPSLAADGSSNISPNELDQISRRVAALQATKIPLTIAAVPETLDGLEATGQSNLLQRLRAASTGRLLLGLPYVGIDARSMGQAELAEQLRAGSETVARHLGDGGDARTWLVGATTFDNTSSTGIPAIDEQLVSDLKVLRFNRIVIPERALTSLLAAVDPARIFELQTQGGAVTQAASVDDYLVQILNSPGDNLTRVSNLLGVVATDWLAQPAQPRGVVIVPSDQWRPSIDELDGLFATLASTSWITPVTLSDYFETVAPLTLPTADGGGEEPATRALRTIDTLTKDQRDQLDAYIDEVSKKRLAVHSLSTMLPSNDPTPELLRRQLLVTSSSDFDNGIRRLILDSVGVQISQLQTAVLPLETSRTSILTRTQKIKLRVKRAGNQPVTVRIDVSSDKLEFPLARRFTVDLKQAETIVEVPVRARTSGSFAMKVEFHTPDGLVEVGAPARVQIRSLAVSGLGLVLSISALVFLAFWWFKDWRRRRNQRIDNVRGHHPAGATT